MATRSSVIRTLSSVLRMSRSPTINTASRDHTASTDKMASTTDMTYLSGGRDAPRHRVQGSTDLLSSGGEPLACGPEVGQCGDDRHVRRNPVGGPLRHTSELGDVDQGTDDELR